MSVNGAPGHLDEMSTMDSFPQTIGMEALGAFVAVVAVAASSRLRPRLEGREGER